MGSTNQERITDLPVVSNVSDTDILYLVQGYVSTSNPGLSVQATIGQLLSLALSQTITSSVGNPNGNLAGVTFQLCWDSATTTLYICTTSGSATTAVWTPVTGQTNTNWINVTSNAQAITPGYGYTANNGSRVIFSLPPTSSIGDRVEIQGFGAGGWRINSGNYQIFVGNLASTATTGYIESTNRYDSIVLVCAAPNSVWTCVGGPQGNITII